MLQNIMEEIGLIEYHKVPRLPLSIQHTIRNIISRTEEINSLVNKYLCSSANIIY